METYLITIKDKVERYCTSCQIIRYVYCAVDNETTKMSCCTCQRVLINIPHRNEDSL